MAGSEREERTERVQEIINAARTCFARQGFYKTSIRDIAREAGIRSPSILHYHFSDKEQIFLAVVSDACDEIATAARAKANTQGPQAALQALDALWQEIDARPEIVPLIVEFCSTALRQDKSRQMLSQFLDQMRDQLL